MKTLFNPEDAEALKVRIATLQPASARQWGTMTATQALAHCSAGMAMAMGEITPPRAAIGRLLGRLIKSRAVGNDEPMRRNSPTSPELLVADTGDLVAEKQRLSAWIDRAATAGPQGCTTHAHPFFGKLTPDEWGNLMHKHLDHHLRQFGV